MNSKKNTAKLKKTKYYIIFVVSLLLILSSITYLLEQKSPQELQAKKYFDLHMHYHFCGNYKKAWEYIVKSTNLISHSKYLAYKAFYMDRGWGNPKNSEEAAKIVTPLLPSLIKSQDADCYFILGHIYKHGIGVEANTQKMLHWYEKSFAHGGERGMRSTIAFYLNQKDYVAAKKWCRKGIRLKIPDAMYRMGCIYFYGEGVPQNREKGLHFLKMAEKIFLERAKQQDILAVSALFEMHFFIVPDSEKGHLWLKKAADLGSIRAIEEEIALAIKDAEFSNKLEMVDNLENIDLDNMAELMYQLACSYEKVESYSKAMYWYKMACDHNHKKSSEYLQQEYYRIGVRYEKGNSSITKDPKEAKEWYKKAALLGNEEAKQKLNEWEKNGK